MRWNTMWIGSCQDKVHRIYLHIEKKTTAVWIRFFDQKQQWLSAGRFLHLTFQLSNPETAKNAECLSWSFWTCNWVQFRSGFGLTPETTVTSEEGKESTNKKATIIELESFLSLLRFFVPSLSHFLRVYKTHGALMKNHLRLWKL